MPHVMPATVGRWMPLQGVARDTRKKYHFLYHLVGDCFYCVFVGMSKNSRLYLGFYGESAGARTQDQRLKRAMLYQLSYALRPHYQVTTFNCGHSRPSTAASGSYRPTISIRSVRLGLPNAIQSMQFTCAKKRVVLRSCRSWLELLRIPKFPFWAAKG